MKKISVQSLIKVTEHSYQEFFDDYAAEIGQKFKLEGSYEMWTPEQPYNLKKTELINSSNSFEFIGKIKVSSNTIILQDEFDQIAYILPSDKYFISAKPLEIVRFWTVNFE